MNVYSSPLLALSLCGLSSIMLANCAGSDEPSPERFETEQAERLFGLAYTPAERDSMQRNLRQQLEGVEALHAIELPNSRMPVLQFNPIPAGWVKPETDASANYAFPRDVAMPGSVEGLAFATVAELSVLIRTRQVTSEALTRMYLDRLKRFDGQLEFLVTLLEEHAMERARAMDEELAAGKYRGPLHGIPYGAKDLLAFPGYKTTWGSMPYKDQVLDETATVIQRLDEAGAVLAAKLTLGELAMGDVWYGGTTKNPWNLEQGSSGSSAGSASAVSAGALPFAIGSETLGSIVSPSTRCGVTGLRPTYGRVSRHGAMALSWSMDKLGPICREAQDCALVLEAIQGADPLDPTTMDMPFVYQADKPLAAIRVGFFKDLFEADYNNKANDQKILDVLDSLGVELVEVKLPEFPTNALSAILMVEASAAFDELVRSNRDDEMVRQTRNAWPNGLRAARLNSAVDYVNANRARGVLIDLMHEALKGVDVVITPSYGGNQLQITNLTGHPALVMPNGFNDRGSPTSITIIGQLFGEADMARVGAEIQKHTPFNKLQPPLFATAKAD